MRVNSLKHNIHQTYEPKPLKTITFLKYSTLPTEFLHKGIS